MKGPGPDISLKNIPHCATLDTYRGQQTSEVSEDAKGKGKIGAIAGFAPSSNEQHWRWQWHVSKLEAEWLRVSSTPFEHGFGSDRDQEGCGTRVKEH